MKKPIFRRYEIRVRHTQDGRDLEPPILYRFFTLKRAKDECRYINTLRRIYGIAGFEYYVKDRREDV